MGDAMTAEQKDLARRFVECKNWRWMPGMKVVGQAHWLGVADLLPVDGASGRGHPECYGSLPDLRDPATLGCILALVREAWLEARGDRRIHCRVRANVYRVYSGVSPVGRWMESEAEALLLALEAA